MLSKCLMDLQKIHMELATRFVTEPLNFEDSNGNPLEPDGDWNRVGRTTRGSSRIKQQERKRRQDALHTLPQRKAARIRYWRSLLERNFTTSAFACLLACNACKRSIFSHNPASGRCQSPPPPQDAAFPIAVSFDDPPTTIECDDFCAL